MATSGYSIEDKHADAGLIWQRASRYHAELREIWTYFTPFRQPTTDRQPERGAGGEGTKRTTGLYDSTGPSAAFSFVSNMKADWMPAFEPFFKLQNGPLFPGQADEAKKRNEGLQKLTDVIHGLTQKIRATTTDEMFSDLFAGTGAMVMSKGPKSREPIRAFAVPTAEIAIEDGPWGDAERIVWRRNFKARHVEQRWPDGDFPLPLSELFKTAQGRNADVLVTQYTWWDAKEERFRLSVWCDRDKKEFHTESSLTNPWIIPRVFKVPGESFGRGFGHLGLPGVKTVNKARELALHAAAFALLGLWMYRHDNVFNPKTASMKPGAFWKVQSTGGPLGPTIQRLDIPRNFDISTVVINDEREQIRRVLLDDELPELTDRVRSPTEIAGRMRRYDRNRGGATTRLAFELVTPFVQRAVDILNEHGMLPGGLDIDNVLTQAIVSAPAAAAQRTDKVERTVSWLQMMQGLFGPQIAALNANIETILADMGRDLGIDEKYIRSKTEADHLKALIDGAVQQALEAQRKAERGQPKAPPPTPDEQAQSYVNGAY